MFVLTTCLPIDDNNDYDRHKAAWRKLRFEFFQPTKYKDYCNSGGRLKEQIDVKFVLGALKTERSNMF